jgi:hypothetical protein
VHFAGVHGEADSLQDFLFADVGVEILDDEHWSLEDGKTRRREDE